MLEQIRSLSSLELGPDARQVGTMVFCGPGGPSSFDAIHLCSEMLRIMGPAYLQKQPSLRR